MSQLLRVPFETQLEDGYCLPACVSMVLAFLDMPAKQKGVAKLLATNDAGTPFSRLNRLASHDVQVEVGANGTLDRLSTEIQTSIPVIAAVQTGWLPHAEITSPHAVVVIGVSDAHVMILDPAGNDKPKIVPINAWLAAWIEMDSVFAVISRRIHRR